MATQPDAQPDIIEPQSPPETVPLAPDFDQPDRGPSEMPPLQPDITDPGRGPDETPVQG